MPLRFIGLVPLIMILTACQPTGGLSNDWEGPPPPPGTPRVTEAVDGLIVGHRLMAAGEYELALDAYYRAGAERGITTDVLSAIGSANLKLGRLYQAEEVLRRAVDSDKAFAPAFNNLGVVLMELNEPGEAKIFFKTAFAIDGGISPEIRENLNRAIALTENPAYDDDNNKSYGLVRRGQGRYLLLSTPDRTEQ